MARLYTLNETADYVWENLNESIDLDELAEIVCARYKVDVYKARRDLKLLLHVMIELA